MKKLAFAASALGIFAGLGGASHGPSEMCLTALNGEPAMTVVPSFLIAGVLAIIVGALVAIWAGAFVGRKSGGLLLILLSIVLLLVGEGIIPPFFGIAGGIIDLLNYGTAKKGVVNP
jgi:hypothetical protein